MATITWGALGGAWVFGADWVGGVVPGVGDDASIYGPAVVASFPASKNGTVLVTLGAGDAAQFVSTLSLASDIVPPLVNLQVVLHIEGRLTVASRLQVPPSNNGFVFTGAVELANGGVLSVGSVTQTFGSPTILVSFMDGLGTTLRLGGYGGTFNFHSTLNGFQPGDVIDLPDVAWSAAPALRYLPFTNGPAVPGPGGEAIVSIGAVAKIDLLLTGAYGTTAAPAFTLAPDATGGTEIIIPCFAAGTRIATPRGQVPIETLRPGDLVATPFAPTPFTPIAWRGWRDVDATRHPSPADVWPIRIATGAIAPGIPTRDLLVSPDHALFFPPEAVLVPARYLTNGATIRQDRGVPRLRYLHLELPTHSIILAEGLPTETYLDTGNRHAFANGGRAVALHPDFGTARWTTDAVAPLIAHGPAMRAIRRHLRRRAYALGWRASAQPELRLSVNGTQLPPVSIENGCHRFLLPETPGPIHLLTQTARPSDLLTGSDDHRDLGVRLREIIWHHPAGATSLPPPQQHTR